jgi:enoyl-CoA hydratase/carnithine racemase
MTTLHVTHADRVCTLTLTGPGKRNALTPDLLRAVVSACEELRQRADIHVMLLRGADGVFTGGADLLSFMADFQKHDRAEVADLGRQAGHALATLPQITVALVEGHCVGGGVVLAAACDLRWAAPGAWFSIPELDIGMPLTWGALPRLVQLLGESRALELVLSRRRFDAPEAHAMGFVAALLGATEVAALSPPDGGARKGALAERLTSLAALPGNALRTTKAQTLAIRAGAFDPADDAQALLRALADPESAQQAQAYMQRRKR